MGKRKKLPDSSPPLDTPPATVEDGASTNNPDHNNLNVKAEPTTPSHTLRWSGGSWRGKAAAVAGLATESISAAGALAVESVPSKGSITSSAQRLSKGLRTPTKGSPSAPSTTKLSVSSSREGGSSEQAEEKEDEHPQVETHGQDPIVEKQHDDGSIGQQTATGGWTSWWSWQQAVPVEDKPSAAPSADAHKANAPDKGADHIHQSEQDQDADRSDATGEVSDIQNPAPAEKARTASWFGLWKSGQNPSQDVSPSGVHKSLPAPPSQSNIASDGFSPLDDETNTKSAPAETSTSAATSWAFWYKEKPKQSSAKGTDTPETGELAITKTPSESAPQPASVDSKGNISPKSQQLPDRPEQVSTPKKRPAPSNESNEYLAPPRNEDTSLTSVDVTNKLSTDDKKASSEASSAKKVRIPRNDLLLPPLKDTFPLVESPSYWQSLLHILGKGTPGQPRHLAINLTAPKIKKALAIGVHGYFPAPWLQKVIGVPTGTSVRFANGAAAAIDHWAATHGQACEIEKVALEGEGMIADRVDSLWKLLLNWIDQIRKAELIIIACHSQGVPVAVMLVAKLIDFKCISQSARIGICAMAGVSLGPFPSFQGQGRFFGGAANELFSFAIPSSNISKAYSDALKIILSHHVRVLYVASIDDQLVSMESAAFSNVSHPYIYRAVFVDGRIHAPDFLTRLVGFAFKLRNLGLSDHGLIRELSAPLAGSLYGGEGHSRIYEDPNVYELAVQHTLETANLAVDEEPEIRRYEAPSAANANPYFLPWAMRGVMEEEYVRLQLKDELEELVASFEEWKPQSKVLKDVKFRLEAVRSRL